MVNDLTTDAYVGRPSGSKIDKHPIGRSRRAADQGVASAPVLEGMPAPLPSFADHTGFGLDVQI